MKSFVEQRILALDIGTKRIGLAIWIPDAKLSRSLPVLERKVLQKDLQKIKTLVEQEKIEALVVGMPYALSGAETDSTRNAKFWMQTLQENFVIPVYEQDESMSTQEAESILKASSSSHRKQKKDSLAAALILEEFIRAHS